VCLEALLKVGGDAYITLRGDRKTLEKIDILHPFAPEKCSMTTYCGCEKMACHPKLWGFQSDQKKIVPCANFPSLKLRGISSEALAEEEASGDTLRSKSPLRPDKSC
jgi:hypothetical protein